MLLNVNWMKVVVKVPDGEIKVFICCLGCSVITVFNHWLELANIFTSKTFLDLIDWMGENHNPKCSTMQWIFIFDCFFSLHLYTRCISSAAGLLTQMTADQRQWNLNGYCSVCQFSSFVLFLSLPCDITMLSLNLLLSSIGSWPEYSSI